MYISLCKNSTSEPFDRIIPPHVHTLCIIRNKKRNGFKWADTLHVQFCITVSNVDCDLTKSRTFHSWRHFRNAIELAVIVEHAWKVSRKHWKIERLPNSRKCLFLIPRFDMVWYWQMFAWIIFWLPTFVWRIIPKY